MRERRQQPFGAARRALHTLRSPKNDLQTVLAKYCTIKGLFRRDGMLQHPLRNRTSLQHDVRFSIFFFVSTEYLNTEVFVCILEHLLQMTYAQCTQTRRRALVALADS